MKSRTGGARLFSLSRDYTIREAGAFAHEQRMAGALVLPRGNQLATWGDDGLVRLWTIDDSRASSQLVATGLASDALGRVDPDVVALRQSPDARWSLVYDAEKRLYRLGNLATIDRTALAAAIFSPDSKYFIWVEDEGGTARVIDLKSQKILKTAIQHDEAILDLAFSHDGAFFATLSYDNTVRVSSPASGFGSAASLFHEQDVRKMWFSADDRFLASVDAGGTARVWTTDGFKLVCRMTVGAPETAKFDPTRLRFYQAATGQIYEILPRKIPAAAEAAKDFEQRTATKL